MISGTRYRLRRVLAWSALFSLVLNVVILAWLLHVAPLLWGARRGEPEKISATQVLRLEKLQPTPAPPVPTPQPSFVPQRVKAAPPVQPPPAAPPVHELSRDDLQATPQPPQPSHAPTLQDRINADQRAYANTVAKLNAQNNPHVIATIDPGTQESASKSYGFHAPAGMHSSSEGSGIITPSQSWHEHGQDCYYARYSYTYPDGAEETGNIVWPVCFDPGTDPFKEGRHEMPFPLPLAGYRLPPGTDLPPIEKDIYARWISEQ
jgi:hypothetical protein